MARFYCFVFTVLIFTVTSGKRESLSIDFLSFLQLMAVANFFARQPCFSKADPLKEASNSASGDQSGVRLGHRVTTDPCSRRAAATRRRKQGVHLDLPDPRHGMRSSRRMADEATPNTGWAGRGQETPLAAEGSEEAPGRGTQSRPRFAGPSRRLCPRRTRRQTNRRRSREGCGHPVPARPHLGPPAPLVQGLAARPRPRLPPSAGSRAERRKGPARAEGNIRESNVPPSESTWQARAPGEALTSVWDFVTIQCRKTLGERDDGSYSLLAQRSRDLWLEPRARSGLTLVTRVTITRVAFWTRRRQQISSAYLPHATRSSGACSDDV